MCMRINCSVLVLDIAWDWHWELVCHNCMQVLLYFPDVCLMEDGSQPSTIANPNSHKHDIASSSAPSLKSNHPWPIRNLKDFQVLLKSFDTHQVRYFQHSAWWLIWYEWRSSLPSSNKWTLWVYDGAHILKNPILENVKYKEVAVCANEAIKCNSQFLTVVTESRYLFYFLFHIMQHKFDLC